MLNKSKRILALTLCILLVMLSLAACRRADGDGDTSGTGDVSAVQPGGNEMGGTEDGVIDLDNVDDVSGGSTTQGDKGGNAADKTTNKATDTKKPIAGADNDTVDSGKGTTTTTNPNKTENNGNGDQGDSNTTTSAPVVAKDPQLDNGDNWIKNPNPV